ncbi:beta-carotene 15,15'-monooxygenase [Natronococcus pandeyae]|uniref:Probable beta-carotene 15,15'-dioxygenase n=1 Tax=Natronococcus pandeyae TaxID=2055836 RepID=A0A8J8Q7T4_9EURY|nr:Brp/Blh family beta-carotene 15,15'-dioxygenase [Natronococcus pandeyae]TYL40712.1 beta-carotene 15,15'-monooxygenase [Natronococcus pandeyae]
MSTGTADGAPNAIDARTTAARLAVLGGVATLLLGVSITAVAGTLPRSVQFLSLGLSVLFLGVPHGAVDHLVLPRARDAPVTHRDLALVGGIYLVAGGLYAVVWWLAPAVAFAAFILLTLTHWGQGDVYALVALVGADHLETRVSRTLTLIVRGGIPMLVPLLAFPAEYAFVTRALVGLFDPAAATALEFAFEPEARLALGIGFATLLVASLALGYRATDDHGPWLIDAGETLGLVAYFAVVPPILAIGLYFPLWHSLRHILRTMLLDGRATDRLARGRLGPAFGRFARDAAPLTVGALLVFAGLALAVPTTPATTTDLLGLYLVGIAILTLPHVVVVTLLDLEAGIWTPRG